MLDYDRIARAHPSLARGQVWCTVCGHTFRFGFGEAQRRGGWPKHCGYTMTIDSPRERAAQAVQRLADGALGRQDGPTDRAHAEHLPLSPDQTPPEGG